MPFHNYTLKVQNKTQFSLQEMSYFLIDHEGWMEYYQTANYAAQYPWLLIKLHCNIDTITAAYRTTRAAWQCYPHFLQELITFKGLFFLFWSYIVQAWSSVVHSNNWLCHHETSVSESHLLFHLHGSGYSVIAHGSLTLKSSPDCLF